MVSEMFIRDRNSDPEPARRLRNSDPEPARRLRKAEGLSRNRLPALLALALGVAAGFGIWQLTSTHRVLEDSQGTISVEVPKEWTTAVETDEWTPPESDVSYAALSAGTATGWNTNADPGHGVFAGILPAQGLPTSVPQHPECAVERPSVDNEESITVVFTDCADDAVTIEHVVQVADNRLLWVQVRAPERGTASEVLDSVAVAGP